MKYKLTILNVSTSIYLVGILIYTIRNYNILLFWGIVAMLILVGIGIVAVLMDLLLQKFMKNRKALNLIELVIVVGLAIVIISVV